jgi:hypothetical protein
MKIRTKDYALTDTEYFRISFSVFLRRHKWLIAFLFITSGFCAFLATLQQSLFYLAFCVTLPFIYILYIIVFFWYISKSPENKNLFKRRSLEITDDFLIGYMEDGGIDKRKLDNAIIMVTKTPKYYLLWTARNLYIYLPLDAFTSTEDIKIFDSFLKNKGLLP